jgi:Bacterial pre-peptidase C-terminal domain
VFTSKSRKSPVRSIAVLLVLATALFGVAGSPTAKAQSAPEPAPQVQLLSSRTQAKTLFGSSPTARTNNILRDSIAAVNGFTVDQLLELSKDSTLWFDTTGAAFFIDPPLPKGTAPEPSVPTANAAIPSFNAFILHSRIGSSKTIYLDFDGHTLGANDWNLPVGYNALPFDPDGSPGAFSENEKLTIIDIWQRVAEDYAPFDVDVTTELPTVGALDRTTSSDVNYGVRALITNTSDTLLCGNPCGGLAYPGTFDVIGPNRSRREPAWVFAIGASSKAIGEATSHEVGHNLNLYHDGFGAIGVDSYYTGHGAWAPIMGVGYDKAIVQFSGGEYNGANQFQDDFAFIAAEGVNTVPDEAGGTRITAASLGTGPSFGAVGIISTRTDVDAYSFTATAGDTITFTATPAEVSPNLDIELRLYNADGTFLGSVNPPSSQSNVDVAVGLGAAFSYTIPASGAYYVAVDGVGALDPASTGYSDYGSLGRYKLTGTRASVDTTNPTITMTNPVGANATTIQGNATDAGGVSVVGVRIYRSVNGGQYWNGSAWQASYASPLATLVTPFPASSFWSYVFDPPQTGGTYYTSAVAVDAAGNFASTPWVPFTIPDSTPPAATISTTQSGLTLNVTGQATDNSGLYGVSIAVYRYSDGTFFNGTTWQAGFTTVLATLASPGAAVSNYSRSFNLPGAGYYLVSALPVDENYNYVWNGWTTVLF